jgi:hypothetical protein
MTGHATILVLACGVSGVQAGEIYKTVDANGTVIYSDHADPAAGQTTVWQDPRYPPHELHLCWANCFTLIYDGQEFHRVDGTAETWTVSTFTRDSVVLHRHSEPADWNGFSADVTYAGHVSNDRLVGVTVNGKPTSGIDASWGVALNTLPGSNAERDAQFDPRLRGPASGGTVPDQPPLDGSAEVAVSAAAAPPPLPAEETQPVAADAGSYWTSGFWYWGGTAYVWVPGAWRRPPAVGLLWTPPYWSFADGRYLFHPGYWGPHVGFYGGINYGFGYFGSGYAKGVAGPAGRSLVSYNGGPGGTTALPNAQEAVAATEAHVPATVLRARAATRVASSPRPVRTAAPVQHVAAAQAAAAQAAATHAAATQAAAIKEPAETEAQGSPSVAPRPKRPAAPKAAPRH